MGPTGRFLLSLLLRRRVFGRSGRRWRAVHAGGRRCYQEQGRSDGEAVGIATVIIRGGKEA